MPTPTSKEPLATPVEEDGKPGTEEDGKPGTEEDEDASIHALRKELASFGAVRVLVK